jgi:monothiol glutaredoxin
MSLDPNVRERIDQLVASDAVVLFMKGQRGAPQCGFSATVCQILDGYVPEYTTVDVLADPAIRDGIKTYSEWPTIPQLYVGGEFIGGCDIIQEMAGDGSLAPVLGFDLAASAAPAITVTPAAAAALGQIGSQQPAGRELHLRIDARFQTGLYFGPEEASSHVVESEGIKLFVDPVSGTRADGMTIDSVDTGDGPGFQIDNPNAPAAAEVGEMSVTDLQQLIASDTPHELFDVRTPDERAIAHIDGARLLDEDGTAVLQSLDRDTMLVFHCHHGGRSASAANHFADQGFTNVWNVTGGIDAWSLEIDSTVPRY